MTKSSFRKKIIYIIIIVVLTIFYANLWRIRDWFEIVSPRSIVGTENIELLWNKDIKIETLSTTYVEFFSPDERSVVFWNSNFLNSLDILTGELLWKTPAPGIQTIRLLDSKFFVTSPDWYDVLDKAPSFDSKSSECSSYYGITTLLLYNAITGEKIWGYRYDGASPSNIFFDDKNVYLEGSNDHGQSNSIVQIDKNTGSVVSINCNRWPNKNVIPTHPPNKGGISSTYTPILELRDMQRLNLDYYFIVEDNSLVLLDKITKGSTAFIEFSGEKLDPWKINIINQKDIVMVYFIDSKQLFGFHLQF
jgi:hypothetical protein